MCSASVKRCNTLFCVARQAQPSNDLVLNFSSVQNAISMHCTQLCQQLHSHTYHKPPQKANLLNDHIASSSSLIQLHSLLLVMHIIYFILISNNDFFFYSTKLLSAIPDSNDSNMMRCKQSLFTCLCVLCCNNCTLCSA